MSIKKTCDNCEFNMGVCAGTNEYYGKPLPHLEDCDGWEMSFNEFVKNKAQYDKYTGLKIRKNK